MGEKDRSLRSLSSVRNMKKKLEVCQLYYLFVAPLPICLLIRDLDGPLLAFHTDHSKAIWVDEYSEPPSWTVSTQSYRLSTLMPLTSLRCTMPRPCSCWSHVNAKWASVSLYHRHVWGERISLSMPTTTTTIITTTTKTTNWELIVQGL